MVMITWTIKTRLRQFQMEARTLLAIGLEDLCASLEENLSTCDLCSKTLQEADIKVGSLIWLRKVQDSPTLSLQKIY